MQHQHGHRTHSQTVHQQASHIVTTHSQLLHTHMSVSIRLVNMGCPNRLVTYTTTQQTTHIINHLNYYIDTEPSAHLYPHLLTLYTVWCPLLHTHSTTSITHDCNAHTSPHEVRCILSHVHTSISSQYNTLAMPRAIYHTRSLCVHVSILSWTMPIYIHNFAHLYRTDLARDATIIKLVTQRIAT